MKPKELEIIEKPVSLARCSQDAHIRIMQGLPLRSGGRNVDDVNYHHAVKYVLPEIIAFLRSHDKIALAAHLEDIKEYFDD